MVQHHERIAEYVYDQNEHKRPAKSRPNVRVLEGANRNIPWARIYADWYTVQQQVTDCIDYPTDCVG